MTWDDFKKIPFRCVGHLSGYYEHCLTYESEGGRFGVCYHTTYKYEMPYRTYTHWRIGSTVYKRKSKFIEALAKEPVPEVCFTPKSNRL